jgi:hypothetical protein
VADIYSLMSKRELDDVRWEKILQVKRILRGETHSAPPEQIAARLIEQMLERGRGNPRWKRSGSRGDTIDGSGVVAATIAGKVRNNDVKASGRKLTRQTPTGEKLTCRGTWGGYEVTGWRYHEYASWYVKVWPVGRPSGWIGYTVTAGIFELTMVAPTHRQAVLHVIGSAEPPHSTQSG